MKRILLILLGGVALFVAALVALLSALAPRPRRREWHGEEPDGAPNVGWGGEHAATTGLGIDDSREPFSRQPARSGGSLHRTGLLAAAAIAVVCLAAAALATVAAAERRHTRSTAANMTGGDPARGEAAIERHGCASCHTIPRRAANRTRWYGKATPEPSHLEFHRGPANDHCESDTDSKVREQQCGMKVVTVREAALAPEDERKAHYGVPIEPGSVIRSPVREEIERHRYGEAAPGPKRGRYSLA